MIAFSSIHITVGTLFCFITAAVLPSQEAPAPTGSKGAMIREAGDVRLGAPSLKEASGLAESRRHAGCLWLINDSGAAPVLHLAGPAGEPLGTAEVEGVGNTDWEDLAAFTMDGKPYLLVADVGDNAAKRETVSLHVLLEPEFDPTVPLEAKVKVGWTVRFRYPDGPRDCESVAVDQKQQKIILVSKRTKPPEVYELPLMPEASEILVAQKTGTTAVPMPEGSARHPYGEQPTAMDISSDGCKAAILTYFGVFVFARTETESWGAALARKPQMLEPHLLPQAEALAFSADGKFIHCTSEGSGAKLVKYK
jgi:hypothetical protein